MPRALSNGCERLPVTGSRRFDGASGLDRVGRLRVDSDPQPARPAVVTYPIASL